MNSPTTDLERFAANAAEVSAMLKAMGVGDLAQAVGLSQSALSQHLAVLREEGLLAFRREAQVAWYRIADPRCEQLLVTLHQLYCQMD